MSVAHRFTDQQVAEIYALARQYWQRAHSEECVPWFPHNPSEDYDTEPCKLPEPDILKNGPDSPYRY